MEWDEVPSWWEAVVSPVSGTEQEGVPCLPPLCFPTEQGKAGHDVHGITLEAGRYSSLVINDTGINDRVVKVKKQRGVAGGEVARWLRAMAVLAEHLR